MALLILLDGQALTGKALHKTYKVTTDFGTFNVPASTISFVHFERGNPSGIDEVVLKSTTTLRGNLQPDPISFKLEDTGDTVSVPHKKLHSLIMFGKK